uniref:Uncharacterized protein n=1 Tax=Nothobranchius kadleci TaxID=1051664 RepID=A0A1A8CZP5_NOTKA
MTLPFFKLTFSCSMQIYGNSFLEAPDHTTILAVGLPTTFCSPACNSCCHSPRLLVVSPPFCCLPSALQFQTKLLVPDLQLLPLQSSVKHFNKLFLAQLSPEFLCMKVVAKNHDISNYFAPLC